MSRLAATPMADSAARAEGTRAPSSMGAFLLDHAHLRRGMHFAELDSDKWRQYAARSHGPKRWLWAREARTLLEFERRIATAFDASILCTPLEQEDDIAQPTGTKTSVF